MRKRLLNFCKRCGTRLDCLIFIAQQQKVRIVEVPRQNHELRLRVVLHFVYHHVARVSIGTARQRQL